MDDPDNDERWRVVEDASHMIVAKALALEGTCTGEHGVKIGKRPFMEQEHGGSFVLMRKIKEDLLDPGKIFP
jgi:D-lactate dehydrogenase (cytochrome)